MAWPLLTSVDSSFEQEVMVRTAAVIKAVIKRICFFIIEQLNKKLNIELFHANHLSPEKREPSHFYIYRYFLPLIDSGLEAAAVDDRFGQRKPVQNDMYVALIRGRMNLIRHVVRVIPPA